MSFMMVWEVDEQIFSGHQLHDRISQELHPLVVASADRQRLHEALVDSKLMIRLLLCRSWLWKNSLGLCELTMCRSTYTVVSQTDVSNMIPYANVLDFQKNILFNVVQLSVE